MALEPVVIVNGTGQDRPAYHEAHEEWSGKRVVLGLGSTKLDFGQARIHIIEPFWSSDKEQAQYEHLAERTAGMLPSERLEAIRRECAVGAVVQAMPRARGAR